MPSHKNPASPSQVETQKLYQDLVETSQDLIWQCDHEGRYTYLNPAWESTFGYKTDEMIGRKFTDFQSPEFGRKDMHVFAQLMQGETIKGYETTHIGKTGKEIYLVFNAKSVSDENGKTIGSRGTAYDITGYKHKVKDLAESEKRYRALVETTDTGYVIIDNCGKVLDANAEYVRLSGHTMMEEIAGRKVLEWTAEEDLGRNRAAVEQCMKAGQIRGLEISYVDKSGRRTPVEINATVMETDGATEILSLCRDITGRKQTEAQKEAALKSLRISEESIRTISNNLSHGMIYQVVRNKDGSRKFTYLSDNVRGLYGVSPEEAMEDADRIYSRVHEQDRLRVFREEEEANRTLSTFRTEARMINPSGEIRWSLFVSSPRVSDDDSTTWDGIEFDITDRKLAEPSGRLCSRSCEGVRPYIAVSSIHHRWECTFMS